MAVSEQPSLSLEEEYVTLFVRSFRVANRILRNDAEAEDVAAETMVRAMSSWRKVNTYSRPWVSRVAANLAIDTLRRRRDTLIDEGSFVSTDPTDRIVVQLALNRLPQRQREALVLHHVVGLSTSETAEAMRLSPKTVKTHLQRGRAGLRHELNDDFERATHAN